MYYDFSVYKCTLVVIMPREVTVKPCSEDENLYTIHPTSIFIPPTILYIYIYIYIIVLYPQGFKV